MIKLDVSHSLLTIENLVFTFSVGFISMLIFRYFRTYRLNQEEYIFPSNPPSCRSSNDDSDLQNCDGNIRENKGEGVNKTVAVKDILECSNIKNEIKFAKVFYATQFGHTEVITLHYTLYILLCSLNEPIESYMILAR